jgi:hypothetical protein
MRSKDVLQARGRNDEYVDPVRQLARVLYDVLRVGEVLTAAVQPWIQIEDGDWVPLVEKELNYTPRRNTEPKVS